MANYATGAGEPATDLLFDAPHTRRGRPHAHALFAGARGWRRLYRAGTRGHQRRGSDDAAGRRHYRTAAPRPGDASDAGRLPARGHVPVAGAWQLAHAWTRRNAAHWRHA